MLRTNKQTNRFLLTLIVLNFLLTISLVGWNVYMYNNKINFMGQTMQQRHRYTLHVGMNDSNTNAQVAPTEEIKAKTDAICAKWVEGFTVIRASGNWQDEKGTKVKEDTLVYYIYNATDKQIKAIMDEILLTLNQSTLLLEKEDVNMEFYDGNS